MASGSSSGDMGAALAGMAKTGNPRIPMDSAAVAQIVNRSAAGSPGGMPRPFGNGADQDPAIFPTNTRSQAMITGTSRGGARYGIRVGTPTLTMPEAGATQANGRVIRGRGTGGSFWGGTAG